MKKLRDIHYKAIGLLLEGKTQTYVAQELLVHWATVCTWMHDPLFLKEMERRRVLPLIDIDHITIEPLTEIEELTEIDLSKIEVEDSLENLIKRKQKRRRKKKKP